MAAGTRLQMGRNELKAGARRLFDGLGTFRLCHVHAASQPSTLWCHAVLLIVAVAVEGLPQETSEDGLRQRGDALFEYDPGANYGLNETTQLSQDTVLATIRGAEQGNKGKHGWCTTLLL
jgi:hypothetical protein